MPWGSRWGWWSPTSLFLFALALAVTAALTTCHGAEAHLEDKRACIDIPVPDGPPSATYLDGEMFVVQYHIAGRSHPDLELHFMVLPQAQWKAPDQPAFLSPPLSYWVDTDGIMGYDEWWLDGKGTGDCKTFLHFVWNSQVGTWVIKEGDKGA